MSDSRSSKRVMRALHRLLEAHRLLRGLGPDRLQRARRLDRDRRPLLQPALHDLLVRGAVLLVVGEHPEQAPGALLLARRVGLGGAEDRRRDEVALQRRDLHHEPAAEQLADQRLEHDRGGEERLRPVARRRQALDVLARLLPDRVLLPGGEVGLPVEALDLVVEVEVVEDHVLREAQLVHGADRQRVVDHVRRRVAVGRRVDVHAEPVLGVRPRPDVLGHDVGPLAVPLGERVRGLGVGDVLLHLADDVRVVAVDRLLPLLVGVEEEVPVGGLQRRPVLWIAAGAVGEAVDPALCEVAIGVRLDVDGHVLVDARAALGRCEVAVAAAGGRGELFRAGLGVGEDGLGDAAFLWGRLGAHVRLVSSDSVVVNLS